MLKSVDNYIKNFKCTYIINPADTLKSLKKTYVKSKLSWSNILKNNAHLNKVITPGDEITFDSKECQILYSKNKFKSESNYYIKYFEIEKIKKDANAIYNSEFGYKYLLKINNLTEKKLIKELSNKKEINLKFTLQSESNLESLKYQILTENQNNFYSSINSLKALNTEISAQNPKFVAEIKTELKHNKTVKKVTHLNKYSLGLTFIILISMISIIYQGRKLKKTLHKS